MWSIKYKLPLILTAVIAAFGLLGSWVSNKVIMPPFLNMDRQHADAEIQRNINTLLDQTDALGAITRDWAAWDDAYQFIQDGNKQFINSNLVASSFDDAPVDGFVFLSQRKQVVWGQLYDPQLGFSMVNMASGSNLLQFINFAIDLERLPLRDRVSSGIYLSNNQVILFAMAPITNSDSTKPNKGFLLGIKKLTPDLLKTLQGRANSLFTLSPAFGKMPSKEKILLTQQLATTGQSKLIDKGNKLIAYHVIPTTDGSYLLINLEKEKTYFQLATTLINQVISWLVIGGLIVFAISVTLIRMYVITPVHTIANHVKDILQKNDYTLQLNSNESGEIGELSNCIDIFVSKLNNNLKQINNLNTVQEKEIKQRKILEAKLKNANEKLRRLASSDGLTGIANRRMFDDQLTIEWRRMLRHNRPLSIIMLDVDYFKRYNEGYGHLQGDNCLIQIAQTIQNKFKRAEDLVARYGSEEFSVILSECNGEMANRLAEEIVREIEQLKIEHHYSPNGFITCSAGVCTTIPNNETNQSDLLRQADENMYNAKATGRNQSWFTSLGDTHGSVFHQQQIDFISAYRGTPPHQ